MTHHLFYVFISFQMIEMKKNLNRKDLNSFSADSRIHGESNSSFYIAPCYDLFVLHQIMQLNVSSSPILAFNIRLHEF